MIYLSAGCSALRVLAVSHCSITDQGLRALAGTLSAAAATDIVRSYNPSAAQTIRLFSDTNTNQIEHLGAAPNNSNDVNMQDLLNGSANSNQTFKANLTPNGCINLTTLEISRCSAITDFGLTAIARACTKVDIQTLFIYFNNKIINQICIFINFVN